MGLWVQQDPPDLEVGVSVGLPLCVPTLLASLRDGGRASEGGVLTL